MGIKHRADSGFRKFRVLRKLRLGGQVRSSEMPYVSYPRPLATSYKANRTNSTFGFCQHTKATTEKPKELFFANA